MGHCIVNHNVAAVTALLKAECVGIDIAKVRQVVGLFVKAPVTSVNNCY